MNKNNLPPQEQLPQQTAETIKLMEAHRQMIGTYGYAVATEHDTYCLAQPSPFRFIPTIATDQTAPILFRRWPARPPGALSLCRRRPMSPCLCLPVYA